MTRVFIADSESKERFALHLLLLDLQMEIVGETGDWNTTFSQAPVCRTEMLLVDWGLLPNAPGEALQKLRKACPAALIVVLISRLEARQQAALTAGADAFISKRETLDWIRERLRTSATMVRSDRKGGFEQPTQQMSASMGD